MRRATVGYTGGAAPSPTYASVCAGDGHTEAVRVEFDPRELSYEALVRGFVEDPRVRGRVDAKADAQYLTAIWTTDDAQRETATRVCADAGKETVPVLAATRWYDAEDRHQQFFGPPGPPR